MLQFCLFFSYLYWCFLNVSGPTMPYGHWPNLPDCTWWCLVVIELVVYDVCCFLYIVEFLLRVGTSPTADDSRLFHKKCFKTPRLTSAFHQRSCASFSVSSFRAFRHSWFVIFYLIYLSVSAKSICNFSKSILVYCE